ncbi:MAG: GtrA family protein [Oscillospiraceae bacterium]|nr:GtrA family protein [Oscillospiraceae bacterium]
MAQFLSQLRQKLSRHLSPGAMRAIRPFLTVQFIIFMLMGILNTAVLICTATLLDIFNHYLLSPENTIRSIAEHLRLNFILGYVISIITSFFMNCKITFRQKPTWGKFITFPISYLPNFIFQYIMVFIFTSLNLNQTIAYICAAVIGTPLTFAAMKLIVFRRRKTDD